jgi:quaternary ammonium compound-resistance protein SugE
MDAIGREIKSRVLNMSWILLVIAGIFEIGFTTFLKFSDSFTKPWPSIGFFICGMISFYFLTLGMKTIPLGTAYAVWTGIGAFGTSIVGIYIFKDPTDFPRLFFLALLIVSIIGLKLFSKH